MQINTLLFPESLYAAHLHNIKGIHFTRREIDIVSCLVFIKTIKKISNFLSNEQNEIAPSSVQSHIANIRRKIGGSSKDGIVDFIEQSDKYKIVHHYYLGLLIQKDFEKNLQIVKNLLKTAIESLTIFPYDPSTQNNINNENITSLLIHRIESDFKKLSDKISIDTLQPFISLTDLKKPPSAKHYHLHILPPLANDCNDKETDLDETNTNNTKSSWIINTGNNNVVAYITETKFTTPLSEQNSLDSPNIVNQMNYYSFFFEVLIKLLPDHQKNLSELKIELQKRYNDIIGFDSDNRNFRKLDINNLEQNRKPQILKLAKKPLTILVLCILIAIFIGFKIYQSSPIETFNISSELNIPADSKLLKRDDIITEMNRRLNKSSNNIKTLALIGSGGSGKTIVSHLYAKQQTAPLIWEINAETVDTIKLSFEELAKKIATYNGEENKIKEFAEIENSEERYNLCINYVQRYFIANKNWILIYDNLEDTANIQEYIPQNTKKWGHGKVIITTRNHNIATHKDVDYVINLPELTQKQKVELFLKINQSNLSTLQPEKNSDLESFMDFIPPFPLDVSIAAYYLRATNTSFENYEKSLHKNSSTFDKLQQSLIQENDTYAKTRYNIITGSLISISKIHEQFLGLMFFISSIDSQNIPRNLLEEYASSEVVDIFIYNLNKYSLITDQFSSPVGHAFSIHRSTKEIMYSWLIQNLPQQNQQMFLHEVATILKSALNQELDEENNVTAEFLAHHCESLLKQNPSLNTKAATAIRTVLGIAYYNFGYDQKALVTLKNNLTSVHGNSTETAEILAHLGNIERRLGNYHQAKNLLIKSLHIYMSNTEDKEGLAKVYMYLAIVDRMLGNYNNAIESFKKSIMLYNTISKNNLHAARASMYLGVVYGKLGLYQEAQRLLKNSLAIYKQHPNAGLGNARVLAHLGGVDRMLGNYPKALDELTKSLQVYKIFRSEFHIDTGWVTYHLGIVYGKSGQTKKAKELLEQSLVIYTRHYGSEHIETARVLNSLGEVFLYEKDFISAETIAKKALAIFQTKNHHEAYLAFELLGDSYFAQAKLTEKNSDKTKFDSLKSQALFYTTQALEIAKPEFTSNSDHLVRLQLKLNAIKNLNHE